ncbi:type VII secretion EssA family protein [Sulfolobus tengchongensis]|uniref:Type VII secretion EssA family protein n=1 Tax=Sulfolobus tengchongensis TaxID=207809 RepID=A0AAX4KYZ0_9CREN
MRWLNILPLLLIIISISSVISISADTSPVIHVYYARYDSVYRSNSIGVGPLNTNTVIYTVSSAIYNTTITQGKEFKVDNYNETTYILTFSSTPKNEEGYINISAYLNNTIFIKSNIPNLIRVIVNTANTSELIWAGFNTTEIHSYAYINGSGKVLLQFANGSTIVNETFNVRQNTTVSEHINLYLLSVSSVNIKTESIGELTVTAQLPRRYSPLLVNINYNGSENNITANGYIVTTAYFNGTLTPALVWKGEGLIPIMAGKGNIRANFETIEFYGENGTVLGYVHVSSIFGVINNGLGKLSSNINIAFTELKIVEVNGVKPIHSNFMGYVYINGVPVILTANEEGNLSSTGIVNVSHVVFVHAHKGILVEISVNSTVRFALLTDNNETYNVAVERPTLVNITHLNVNGNIHVAQEVLVNVTSTYIVFNVSVINNGSIVGVYKDINGTLVKLNSSNYFILNGKLVIFDDPVTTYYILYSAQQPTTTTSTSSSTTLSTSSSSLLSSSSLSTSSSSSSSNNLLYIIIAVIVIVIIIVAVVVLLRRR